MEVGPVTVSTGSGLQDAGEGSDRHAEVVEHLDVLVGLSLIHILRSR